MDPYVIDIPWPARFVLVNFFIVPSRSRSSAKLYEKVWSRDGSPLLKFSRDLEKNVRARLPGVTVELGMRYGNPSLDESFLRLRLARSAPEKIGRAAAIPSVLRSRRRKPARWRCKGRGKTRGLYRNAEIHPALLRRARFPRCLRGAHRAHARRRPLG